MRFDDVVELIINEKVDDGLGGRTEAKKVITKLNANVEELGIEESIKIFGEITIDTLKVIVLGRIVIKFDSIKYNGKYYKVLKQRPIKNKTSFLLEVIEND